MPRGALLPVEALPGATRAIRSKARCARAETDQLVAVPRLARHEIVLDDDHRVEWPCTNGLVVLSAAAEGILYAQTLSRLVGMGFKVVAVDGGPGATRACPPVRRPRVVRLALAQVSRAGIRRASSPAIRWAAGS